VHKSDRPQIHVSQKSHPNKGGFTRELKTAD
jgi:hypothetical protein